ncbi:MAG TPA: ATP-binding protein [Solirubrobacteraceae bacterium]|nr:ATP-binding protein [Solirubrobacteraceae bacterium]
MTAQAELSLASELRLGARASELADARDYAAAAAAAFGLSPDDSYDFVYAVNEAVTNAIRHGAPDEQGQIVLSVSTVGERLVFSVRDFGTFAMSAPTSAANPEGGRGFALMEQLVDDVQVQADRDGTTVTLSKARIG